MSHYELIDGVPWVDGREVRWAVSVRNYDQDYPPGIDLPTSHARGFHVLMENSMCLSTQWGDGNYCSNYTLRYDTFGVVPWNEQSPDAEVACWWETAPDLPDTVIELPGREPMSIPGSNLLKWPSEDEYADTVQGYFPASRWWMLLDVLMRLPKGAPIADNPDVFLLRQDA